MAVIKTPQPSGDPIKTLDEYLKAIGPWQTKTAGKETATYLSQLWYRGVNSHYPTERPGVYRDDFLNIAKAQDWSGEDEEKQLRLEREIISQFRTAGAVHLKGASQIEIYFMAQHYGMPTRLLDWSTNPLAALFFACDGKPEENGCVHAMDARKIIPASSMKNEKEKMYQAIMTMRHPYVSYAINVSFWSDLSQDFTPYVLPIRPDIVPGRIGQQSSCFTFHMHKAADPNNETLITLLIDGGSKESIRNELHRLNIDQYTIYTDLDHLSKELKRNWGYKE